MKKLIFIGVVLALLAILVAVPVTARCDIDCCCVEYCESLTFDFEVSYKEPVFLYFEQWGFGYWTSEWVTVLVEDMHDREEAASSLGLRQGYDCKVSKVF